MKSLQETKTDTGPLSPDQVRKFISENDDFGFEMRVAAAIREIVEVPVFHGATYTDPVSGKPRQYDLRFRVGENRATLYFAVECKNVSPHSPVIVCGRPADIKEAFHEVVVSQCCLGHEHSHTYRVKSGVVYRAGSFVGKTILKPDKNNRSNDAEIYDRWSQAIASAHDLVHEAMTKPAGMDLFEYGAVFPWVVVPDGTLWCATYDDAGQLTVDPKSVDRCSFHVAHTIERGTENRHNPVCLSHIEFATLTGFREFLSRLRRPVLDWEVWLSDVRSRYRGN